MRKYWHTAAMLFSGLFMALLAAAFLLSISPAHSAEPAAAPAPAVAASASAGTAARHIYVEPREDEPFSWYVRAQGGTPFTWSMEHRDFELRTRPGWSVRAAVGREIARAGPVVFAAEFEGGYDRSPIDNAPFAANLNTLTLMGNVVALVDLGRVEPYAGGGIGWAVNSFELEDRDVLQVSDYGLGWRAFGGVCFRVTDRLCADLRYAYEGEDLISIGGKLANDHFDDTRRHTVLAGLRFRL